MTQWHFQRRAIDIQDRCRTPVKQHAGQFGIAAYRMIFLVNVTRERLSYLLLPVGPYVYVYAEQMLLLLLGKFILFLLIRFSAGYWIAIFLCGFRSDYPDSMPGCLANCYEL